MRWACLLSEVNEGGMGNEGETSEFGDFRTWLFHEWRVEREKERIGEEEKERVKSKNGGKLKILFWRASNIVKLEGN